VFSYKVKQNRDPHYRIVYALEFITVLIALLGLALVWWRGGDTYNAFGLLSRSTAELKERDPNVLGQPLIILWLVWPSILVSGLRSFTGILVTPVSYRMLALSAWIVALGALAHFYINFGMGEISELSPLKDGDLQQGFWVTAVPTAILGLLILGESLLKPGKDPFIVKDGPSAPVTDAEKLWRGEYLSCPYCGTLNEPGAKTCYACTNLLFNFMDEKKR
jgi:hypothetical protein